MGNMRIWMVVSSLVLLFASQVLQSQEAPSGFDGKSNGMVDDQTHQADQEKFDEVEGVADGLGPLYNAQSCAECHQNPTSGGASQITEVRVGHLGPDGRFRNPDIPIAGGTEIISAHAGERSRHLPECRVSRDGDPGASAGKRVDSDHTHITESPGGRFRGGARGSKSD